MVAENQLAQIWNEITSLTLYIYIAVSNLPHRYGNSHAIWDHTVLPAIRQRRHSLPYPSKAGFRDSDPWGMQYCVGLVGRLYSEMVYPLKDGHPSKY